MPNDIKTMQLYPRADRIYRELRALGHQDGGPLTVEVLNQFDQLHYHGTKALDAAIQTCGITGSDHLLEIGSGWGGCARYLAAASGATVTAVELQEDYNTVAQDLTRRAALVGKVHHLNGDFLTIELPPGGFDHAVSWLALFHIPERATYLAKLRDVIKPEGMLFAEDLYLIKEPAPQAMEDFRQHLFPNSLVSMPEYTKSMQAAGFEVETLKDMTADWTAFTAARLADFHNSRLQYETVHGADAYATIETFYRKMAGYFAQGLVGGVQFGARRR